MRISFIKTEEYVESQNDDILTSLEHCKAVTPIPLHPIPYRRIPFEERLRNIGIADNFDFFMQYLDCKINKEYWKRTLKSFWYQPQHRQTKEAIPQTKYVVLAHLEGQYWIARPLPQLTHFFAIDLDYHSPNKKELIARYDRITNILPNPVVFQSRKSRGLHLYWFFKSLRCTENVSQRLKFFLDCNNLFAESGQLETFPGICHHLRLPLGRDSYLLDNKTLDSLNLNLHDSIEFIRTSIGNGEILFLKEYDNPLKPKNTNQRFTYDSIRRTNAIVNMESLTSGIVAEPIREYGTRNRQQMDLIRRYAKEGHSEGEVFELMMQWYRSHQHKSKDWEHNPLLVEKELKSGIQNWFTKMHHRNSNIKGTLTLTEIEFIIDKAMRQKPFVNIGQRDFKLQKFIFNLLLFYKSMHINKLNLAFNTRMQIPGIHQELLLSL